MYKSVIYVIKNSMLLFTGKLEKEEPRGKRESFNSSNDQCTWKITMMMMMTIAIVEMIVVNDVLWIDLYLYNDTYTI